MLCPAAACHLMPSDTEFPVSNDCVDAVSENTGKWLCVFCVCTNLQGTLCSLTFTHIQLSVTFTKVHLLPKAKRRRDGSGCKAWTLAKFTSRASCVFLQCYCPPCLTWSHMPPLSVLDVNVSMQVALSFHKIVKKKNNKKRKWKLLQSFREVED